MSDAKAKTDLLENLDLLMNFDLLKNEKDWALLRDLNEIPAAPKAAPANEKEVDYDK